jgi:hypothetical protein
LATYYERMGEDNIRVVKFIIFMVAFITPIIVLVSMFTSFD